MKLAAGSAAGVKAPSIATDGAGEEAYKLAELSSKPAAIAGLLVASIQKPENQITNSQFSGMKTAT